MPRARGGGVSPRGSRLHAEPEVRLLQLDARELPFDAEFDVVGASTCSSTSRTTRRRSPRLPRGQPGRGRPDRPAASPAAVERGRRIRGGTSAATERPSEARTRRIRGGARDLVRLPAAPADGRRRGLRSDSGDERYDPLAEHRAADRLSTTARNADGARAELIRAGHLAAGRRFAAGRGGDGPRAVHIPFNRPSSTGPSSSTSAEAIDERPHLRETARSRSGAAVARGAASALRGAAHALVHGALEMAALLARARAGRRGDHAVVHVRLDGERVRAARRRAGVRGHPAGHAEPGRAPGRAGDHAADARDRAGPLRRCRVRHGRDPRDRARARPVVIEDAAQASRAPTAAGRSARSATSARSASTRRRTSSAARAARCSSTTPTGSSAPRSSTRRAPTGGASSAARSTSTRGGRRLVVPAERDHRGLPLGAARRGRRRSRSGGSRSGTRTTRPRRPRGARWCDGRSFPTHCGHNAHMYYLLASRRRRDRDAVIEPAQRRGVNAVFHYVPLHSAPGRAALRPRLREPRGDGQRQRAPRPVAAMGRHGAG